MASDPRALLAEADRLRRIADRATELSAAMSVERNGSVEIGRTTLYQHQGYPEHLVLINAMRGALDSLALDHAARADEVESRVVLQAEDVSENNRAAFIAELQETRAEEPDPARPFGMLRLLVHVWRHGHTVVVNRGITVPAGATGYKGWLYKCECGGVVAR